MGRPKKKSKFYDSKLNQLLLKIPEESLDKAFWILFIFVLGILCVLFLVIVVVLIIVFLI